MQQADSHALSAPLSPSTQVPQKTYNRQQLSVNISINIAPEQEQQKLSLPRNVRPSNSFRLCMSRFPLGASALLVIHPPFQRPNVAGERPK